MSTKFVTVYLYAYFINQDICSRGAWQEIEHAGHSEILHTMCGAF